MVSTWKFMWHRPGVVALEHGELVVHRVDPHQAGGVAEPVRDAGVEPRAPEPVGLVHVGRVQAQVAELGDPGAAAEGHRPGHRLLLVDQLNPITERVIEPDELTDPTGPGLVGRPAVHADAGPLELGLGGVERVRVRHGEAGGDDPGGTLDQGQAVVPAVGAQVRDAHLGGRHQFQADDLGGEAGRGVQVGGTGPDVGDVGERDHARPGSGEDGGEVDVDLPVAHLVAVEDQDVAVGHGDRLAVQAAVLHVDLHDDGVADLVHLQDVVGQAVDRGPEALHPLLHGGVPDGRVHVGEAEPHVRREVRDELVGVHAVDVGEDGGYVTGHGALLRWNGRLAGGFLVGEEGLGRRGAPQVRRDVPVAGYPAVVDLVDVGEPLDPRAPRVGVVVEEVRSDGVAAYPPARLAALGRASGRRRPRSRRWTGPRSWRGGSRGGCWR